MICAVFLVSIQLGCSSSPQQATSRPPGAISTAQVTTPAEIRSLELDEQGQMVSLRLSADRQLVWTNYRDSAGNLVVELPNSVLAETITNMTPNTGLVSGVTIEQLDDADRPLVRLVVRTREESEHALSTEGQDLELQLTPVGYVPLAEDPPVALAYEPLPEEETLVYEPLSEEETLELAADPAPALGTPEAPQVGPPPSGVRATRLQAIEVLDRGSSTAVRVVGDGEFSYSTFRLENPERFVIDLEGVVNTSPRSNVEVGSRTVEQIRVGQFKPRPEPVSRVVFDLHAFAAPVVERGADGLVVRFGSGAPPERAMPAVAEVPAAEGSDSGEVAVLEETTLYEETAVYEETTVYDDPVLEEPVVVEETTVVEESTVLAETEEGVEMTETTVITETTTIAEADAPPADPMPEIETYDPEPEAVDTELTVAEVSVATPEIEVSEIDELDTGAEVPTWTPPPAQQEAPAPEVQIAEVPPPSSIPVFEPPPSRQPQIAQGPPARPLPTSDVELFEAQQVQLRQQEEETSEPVFPQFEALVVSRREREYVGNPISMSLKNADLVETLRSFAKFSDLNFVIQPGVQGSVTVELTLVPWDQALEQILKINNLGMDIDGTIVRIAPIEDLRREAEAERQLAASRQQAIPLRTVLKSVSYATASEVAALLRNRTGSILSSRGTVQVDQRTNTLIIRELPSNLDTVLAVVENLDTPEPQVTIEARIIEATKQFSRSLGISWGFEGVASQEFGNTTGLQFPNNIDTDGGVELLTGGANGFLNLSLGNVLDTFRLNTTIQAAESEGLVNVISAPRVTTLNNESASIQSGLQIPIQTVSNRTVSVQFVNATLQLQVTPHVTAEGTIMMDINVSKKEPQLAFAIVGATNAPIATKEAQTKVVVRDGGTAVIGGIYEVTSNQNQDRVPGLANIPVIGHLFKNRSRDDANDELMIFITPRIVQM